MITHAWMHVRTYARTYARTHHGCTTDRPERELLRRMIASEDNYKRHLFFGLENRNKMLSYRRETALQGAL